MGTIDPRLGTDNENHIKAHRAYVACRAEARNPGDMVFLRPSRGIFRFDV